VTLVSNFRSPSLVTLVLSLAAVAAYLGYRSLTEDSVEEAYDAADSGEPAPGASTLVDELPDFSLDNLAGDPTPISTWQGRPLIVNFWATWCAPCLREIPLLKDFQSRHTDVQVVGIAIDRVEPVRTFAEEMDFNYPVLVGPEAMNAAGAFGVDFVALPFTVFTSAPGSVIGVHTGELHAEHLENLRAVLDDLGSGAIDREIARQRLAGLR
jgi:thiol-disulfide isomerase/thioredoxin